MSCYFLGSGEHLIQVLSAKKINREKIPTYLSARRRIRQKITEFYGEDIGERIIFLWKMFKTQLIVLKITYILVKKIVFFFRPKKS